MELPPLKYAVLSYNAFGRPRARTRSEQHQGVHRLQILYRSYAGVVSGTAGVVDVSGAIGPSGATLK